MRKIISMMLFTVTLLMASATLAQNPNYDVGPVWRVTYYSVKPGQGDAFWKDWRENIKPLYEEFKKAGYITEYKAFINPTVDHPQDSRSLCYFRIMRRSISSMRKVPRSQ